MKKIVFCVSNDLTQDRRMMRICASLAKAGHQVTLIGRQLPGSGPLPQVSFEMRRIKCTFHRGPKFYAEFNIRLYLLLRRMKADILGAVDYDTLRAVTMSARGRPCKVVFDAHEWFEEVPELIGRDKVKRYWMKIARQGIPRTDLRYTVSPGIAAKLEALYDRPFEVIHNFPPLAAAEPLPKRDDILMYVGVLNRGRGLEEMIKAMHAIDAKLWLVGDGELREKLWRLAGERELLHKIEFKGFVPPEQLHELLCKARIGLNLLDGTSQSYRHSLANKFFDYVHAGVPQVCMDFPEYRSLYERHGVAAMVHDLKESSIVYAINHLLGDRNYWFNMHVACLDARKEWCWEREEPRLLELIARL